VGVVLLDSASRAFVAKRADGKNSAGPPPYYLWQFPQGGIDKGEEPLAAAKRELYEETGVKSAELLAEASPPAARLMRLTRD
jgi:putative (di)nucleoside polyphosphate hydrolase